MRYHSITADKTGWRNNRSIVQVTHLLNHRQDHNQTVHHVAEDKLDHDPLHILSTSVKRGKVIRADDHRDQVGPAHQDLSKRLAGSRRSGCIVRGAELLT